MESEVRALKPGSGLALAAPRMKSSRRSLSSSWQASLSSNWNGSTFIPAGQGTAQEQCGLGQPLEHQARALWSLSDPWHISPWLSRERDPKRNLKKGHWEGTERKGRGSERGWEETQWSARPQGVTGSANTVVRWGRPVERSKWPGSPPRLATCCRRQRRHKLLDVLGGHSQCPSSQCPPAPIYHKTHRPKGRQNLPGERKKHMARMELIPHWIGLMALEDMRETGSCRVSSGTPKAQPEPGAVVYAYSSSLKEGEAGEFCGVQATNQNTVSEERERMEG